jgi:hypothetical protein
MTLTVPSTNAAPVRVVKKVVVHAKNPQVFKLAPTAVPLLHQNGVEVQVGTRISATPVVFDMQPRRRRVVQTTTFQLPLLPPLVY